MLAACAAVARGPRACAAMLAPDGARARPRGPRIGGCPVFPASDAWNRDVSRDPVDPRSDEYVALDRRRRRRAPGLRLGPLRELRAPDHDRGSRDAGARRALHRLRRRVRQGPVSDPARRRGSRAASDRHVIVVQRGRCRLYELFGAQRVRRPLGGRERRDLRPPPPAPAARRLDLGRRRRPADHARPRAARRGLARARSATRCASPRRARSAPTSRPRATPPAPATTRRCRRWALRLRLKASFSLRAYHGQSRAILRGAEDATG